MLVFVWSCYQCCQAPVDDGFSKAIIIFIGNLYSYGGGVCDWGGRGQPTYTPQLVC